MINKVLLDLIISKNDIIYKCYLQDEKMGTWDIVCTEILDVTIPVWDEFLKDLFLQRVKVSLTHKIVIPREPEPFYDAECCKRSVDRNNIYTYIGLKHIWAT